MPDGTASLEHLPDDPALLKGLVRELLATHHAQHFHFLVVAGRKRNMTAFGGRDDLLAAIAHHGRDAKSRAGAEHDGGNVDDAKAGEGACGGRLPEGPATISPPAASSLPVVRRRALL